MSELKPVIIQSDGDYVRCSLGELYLKEEVDEAIAELKEFAEDACLERDDNQTAIDELQAENAELKAEIKRKEGVGQRWFERCMEERIENVRLKRALWIARALRAKECKYKYETWERHEESKVYKDYDMIAIVGRKARTWRKVESKCRAKAEEYK